MPFITVYTSLHVISKTTCDVQSKRTPVNFFFLIHQTRKPILWQFHHMYIFICFFTVPSKLIQMSSLWTPGYPRTYQLLLCKCLALWCCHKDDQCWSCAVTVWHFEKYLSKFWCPALICGRFISIKTSKLIQQKMQFSWLHIAWCCVLPTYSGNG